MNKTVKGGDAVKDDDDEYEDGPDPVLDLLATSAEWLVADPDPQAFIERVAREGPSRFAGMWAVDDQAAASQSVTFLSEDARNKDRFFRSLAWSIASAMPLPGNGFKPLRLALPGRNEACVCGSGVKFKQCCSAFFAHVPPLDPGLLGALVVRALPTGLWATLPQQQHVTPDMVVAAAGMMGDEGRDEDALLLLEPWAALPPPWPDSRADLLDLLGDLYLDLRRQRERELLAHNMVRHGGKAMQSMGWQRLCLMATDAGDEDGARRAFEAAQRLTPNEPRVALLEVTTLLGQGQAARARERAAFHARRLSRLPEAFAIADRIEMLEEFADPNSELSLRTGSMLGESRGADAPAPALAELQQWLEALPAPRLRLTLPGAACADLGELRPTAAAKKALRQWHEVFEFTPPRMAWEGVGDDALDAFASDAWLPLLRAQPLLADCFDVIDGLVLALDALHSASTSFLQTLLMERALRLWQLLRERQPGALCEWSHVGNRPALRLLASRIEIDTSPRADEAYPWLVQLVRVLNPHDNHGLRERLVAVYLRRGEAAAALALSEHCPDDMLGMTLLHARALLALGRLDEAGAVLGRALQRNAHARKLLLASRAPKRPDVTSYAPGSVEEARIALAHQFDLWRDDPVVRQWLRQRLLPAAGDTPGRFD